MPIKTNLRLTQDWIYYWLFHEILNNDVYDNGGSKDNNQFGLLPARNTGANGSSTSKYRNLNYVTNSLPVAGLGMATVGLLK